MEENKLPTMYGLAETDPEQELVQRKDASEQTLGQIDRIMAEMGRMRAIERRIMRSSQDYMKLNETDMRALRKLISAKHGQHFVTPGELARYLGISSASVTKMIDRLEAGGHVTRRQHPTDRRSQYVDITEDSHLAAREQVGRHHAQRFEVLRSMSSEERETVIKFLSLTSDALEGSLDGQN